MPVGACIVRVMQGSEADELSNPFAPGTTAEGLTPVAVSQNAAAITFLLSTDDYLAFHSRSFRWGMRKYVWFMIAGLLAFLWSLNLFDPASELGTAPPIIPYETLIVLTAILIATPVLSPLLIRRQLRRYYEHMTRSMTVEIAPGGLRVHSDVSDLRYQWHGISHLNITKDHLFIQINQYQSFIVPRRAFPDSESDARFRALLAEYAPREGQSQ